MPSFMGVSVFHTCVMRNRKIIYFNEVDYTVILLL